MRSHLLLVSLGVVSALTATAAAERVTGRVVDRATGQPIQGAVVHIAATDGAALTAATAADGSYGFDVEPGLYRLTFFRGAAQQSTTVAIEAGKPMRLTSRLDNPIDEVIVLDEAHRPPVLPRAILGGRASATPPYSDRAILEDAWTRAWLLLDVDDTGRVAKLKILNRPGYDLESIAVAEGFRLRFTPARDESGRAVRTFVVWSVEWPAQSFLRALQGITTRMPELSKAPGMLGAYNDDKVPCRGSGPWQIGSVYKGYKDCSRPDLDRATTEPWIVPSD